MNGTEKTDLKRTGVMADLGTCGKTAFLETPYLVQFGRQVLQWPVIANRSSGHCLRRIGKALGSGEPKQKMMNAILQTHEYYTLTLQQNLNSIFIGILSDF
jgi:hypothetical protein